MQDSEIIGLYWSRDERAIDETSQKYGGGLKRMSKNILSSAEDAAECVNDTYLGAWNTMPPKRPEHLFGYLARLCRNLCLNKLDWRKAEKRSAPIVELTRELEMCLPSPDDVRRSSGEEIGAALTSFLNAQPEQSRLIFLRRYWYSDSIKDISRRYGASVSKVKTTLFRTRNKLKEHLESEGIQL